MAESVGNVDGGEIEMLELVMEDGTTQSFAIFHEFEIEGHAFVVVVPEADLELLLEGDPSEEIEISYDVLQVSEDGEAYAPPEERYALLASAEANGYMEERA
jgi:uncharacterized protein YrzB (UPF0473 family)